MFFLVGASSADKKAEIHALNHSLCSNSTLLPTQLNHALILMSLENVKLQSASSAPAENFKHPNVSGLLFDHPFNLDIVSKEKSLISVSQSLTSSPRKSEEVKEEVPTMHSLYTLNVDRPHCNLQNFSTLEVYEFNGLLQELMSMHATHPYLEVFEHKHSESIILVLHTGFDGSPVHTYKSSSHTHTKVGFQNYLKYVVERYGHLIEEAIEEDMRREEEYSIEMDDKQKSIILQKLKEAEERQQDGLAVVPEEPLMSTPMASTTLSTPDKIKQRVSSLSQRTPNSKTPDSKISSAKKKDKLTVDVTTTLSSTPDLQKNEEHFKMPKRFTGYDLGDIVLLKESVHTTVFTADGIQLQSKRLLPFDDDEPSSCEISLLHNGHKLSTSQVWSTKEQQNNLSKDMSSPTAGIPQPPPLLQYASLSACFSNSLRLSCSYYGPKANGDLPYLPDRSSILNFSPASEQSRATSRQASSPKLNKKQLEQQQQLLEQQRLQEEKQEKERQAAQAKYEYEYTSLVRNNKYQQLFINTECGLNVHCQAMIDLEADPSITDGSDAITVVKQWYSYSDTATHLSEHISRERCRYYHPEGYVVKCMADKSVVILSADGYKYRTATSTEVEFFLDKKNHTPLAQVELDSIDQSTRKITSATRVTFADDYREDKSMIWLVTSPLGKIYLWQEPEKTKKATEVEEETGIEESGRESVTISCEDDDKNVFVEYGSLHLLRATDPITKEVQHVNNNVNNVCYCTYRIACSILYRCTSLEKTMLHWFSVQTTAM